MTDTHSQLRTVYHKIIKAEVDKYNNIKNLKNLFLEREEIENVAGNQDILNELIKRGYILEFTVDGRKLYRSLHMDIASRAAYGVKPYRGASGRVMEKDIMYKEEPILPRDYVKFLDNANEQYKELRKKVKDILKEEKLVEAFFKGLHDSGIRGLTAYQFESIMKILTSDKRFFLVSAPTGFGKTYVYLLVVLIDVLKQVSENKNGVKAVLFYPRKSLEADQMSDIIKVLNNVNKYLDKRIRVGIYDGSTPKETKEVTERQGFRGIALNVSGKLERLYLGPENGKVIVESDSGRKFDWIIPTKRDMQKNPPDVLITNLWSYAHALTNPKRWEKKYINPETAWFVFDEVHIYRENMAGVLRYLLKMLSTDVSQSAKFILSSATIPKSREFLRDLGVKDYLDLTFRKEEYSKYANGTKLNIYLMLALRPDSSWETFAHELGLFLGAIGTLRGNSPQSIIFVDSIREIERIRNQLEVAARRGKIRSHFFNKDGMQVEEIDPYSLVHYAKSALSPSNINIFEDKVLENIDYHYADRADRHRVEERLKNGNVSVVYATSTLELGVNYNKVSVVVNLGIPRSVESIIQRMGRAGRDLESTLNTALGIVIVRPTPMEYYYAYKGLDYIINFENSRGIPISYNNHFAILFSALLRTMLLGAKDGRGYYVRHMKFEEVLELAKRIWREYLQNKDEILRGLELPVDSKMQIEELIEDLMETLNKLPVKSVESRCLTSKRLSELLEGISRTHEKVENLEELLDELGGLIEKILEENPELDNSKAYKETIDEFRRTLKEARKTIDEWKKLQKEIDEERVDLISASEKANELLTERLEPVLTNLRNYANRLRKAAENLKGRNYERAKKLKEQRSELDELKEYLNKLRRERIEKVLDELSGTQEEPIAPFVCEAMKYLRDLATDSNVVTGLNVVEVLLGIKFLGNEFLDKKINTGIWIPGEPTMGHDGRLKYKYKNLKEYSFSSVVYRVPPFELGTIPWEPPEQKEITDIIGGRYVWLLYPEDGITIISKMGKHIRDLMKTYRLGVGTSEHFGSFYDVSRIDFIDLLTLSSPLLIKIPIPDERKELYIKYGSWKVGDVRGSNTSINKLVRSLYEENNAKKQGTKNAVMARLNSLKTFYSQKQPNDGAGIKFNYIRYCELGRVISTDPFDFDCPVRRLSGQTCPYERVDNNGKCRYWITNKRRTFPKVYLKRHVKLPKTLENQVGSMLNGIVSMIPVAYYELSETPAHFVYDTVSIYVPISPIESVERSFRVYPIGYDAITSMIVLGFNPKFLETIIRWIYANDQETLEVMAYKYYLHRVVKQKGIFGIDVSSLGDIKDMKDKLKKVKWWDFNENGEEIRKFLQFSLKVLLHSLAHRFIIYLTNTYGFDESKLTYSVNENEGRVYIVENSKNDGIGIVETFSSEIRTRGEAIVFVEFLRDMVKFFKRHNERVRREMLTFSIEAEKEILSSPESQELLRKVEEKLNKGLKDNEIDPKRMDYITYRFLLKDVLNEREGELIGNVLDYTQTPHICYDGCNLCLYFGRDCTEATTQQYTLSKRLLVRFAEAILGGCITFDTIRGFEHLLKGFTEGAKTVYMNVAFVDEEGIRLLKGIQSSGANVRINTRGNDRKPQIIKELKKELGNENVNKIKVPDHKKVYQIEYKGGIIQSLIISGSPNLLRSSLRENRENVTIVFHLGDEKE
ncbi:DEAD/DEAH box helicase [Thermococcus sp. 21S7]|uniref:DEAD/DEAH box helicase n=1 Tax=Thermococcus sp. 21S7 TaxID=1638221 RepID=UPI00143BBBE7|nr:DEAD/DEAH box helicase [Thermococcus sp. 21S7]NJE61877.1 DEAD/DEAH box helicase [Thermococcus sp. 21S7]